MLQSSSCQDILHSYTLSSSVSTEFLIRWHICGLVAMGDNSSDSWFFSLSVCKSPLSIHFIYWVPTLLANKTTLKTNWYTNVKLTSSYKWKSKDLQRQWQLRHSNRWQFLLSCWQRQFLAMDLSIATSSLLYHKASAWNHELNLDQSKE